MLDIILGNRGDARCDGVSRRDFLRIGAVGAASVTLPNRYVGVAAARSRSPSASKVWFPELASWTFTCMPTLSSPHPRSSTIAR